MSAFDRDFYYELSRLDQSILAAVKYGAYPPDINQMHSCKQVSDQFKNLTVSVKYRIQKSSNNKYKLHEFFRCEPHHIYTYIEKLSFRKQLNIAFSVEGLSEDYNGNRDEFDNISDRNCTARIGIGFRMEAGVNNDGAIDYFLWESVVRNNQAAFDTLFSSLGSYGEPIEIFSPLTAAKAITNRPDPKDDWRFFGRQFNLQADAHILCNLDAFTNESVRIFRAIDNRLCPQTVDIWSGVHYDFLRRIDFTAGGKQ